MWVEQLPRTGNGNWEAHLNRIQNIGKLISNVRQFSNTNISSQCLSIARNISVNGALEENTNPAKLAVHEGPCNTQNYALCKLKRPEPGMTISPPPKFPCMTKNPAKKKREISYGNYIKYLAI